MQRRRVGHLGREFLGGKMIREAIVGEQVVKLTDWRVVGLLQMNNEVANDEQRLHERGETIKDVV